MMIAAALLATADTAFAGSHEASAPPPAPKQEGPPAKAIIGKNGPILVDLKGMTLYTFARDTSVTASSCDAKCAEKRPPLIAPDNAVATGDFTVITRKDGTKMWAYRYRPLYTSQLDGAPGEINGNDPSQAWHIARPY